MPEQIHLKEAVEDLLKEQGILLKDLLDMMDEENGSVTRSISRISDLHGEQLSAVERRLSFRQINLLTFVVCALYLNNMSGLYKGMLLIPRRQEVMAGQRVTFDGLKAVARALGMSLEEE